MSTTDQSNNGKSPTHIAYQVRGREGEKGFWTRIGAAWPTKSGGFNIQFDAVPLDGRVVLLPASEKKD